ncbi:carboxypeptidase-like regulatory domain-containing protein [Belliella sp. DSM 107340]|uniref:Carboxypeptidase-like regulatory domain-containing protein n=1 Tax=Belliella calami TaxID=2923436 RepID=A0ABS9ULR2_9BACT|nr:carboxypeptidase-like regulatory domain-containing protein [Belliella calami]MCH7397105.1 carboxypeptidase-like regulatory domain-containing protein [Belliella calami]
MANKNLKISIKNPCDKKWDSLSINENGGFCSKCKTTVLDFTNLSNEEILQYMNKSNQKVCGKINKHHKSHLFDTARTYKHSLAFKVITGLFLFAGTDKINAKNQIPQDKNYTIGQTSQELLRIDFQVLKNNNSESFISGKVIDAITREPIPGAVILLKNTQVGTTSSIEGKFKIDIPNDLKRKKNEIEVRFIGYETISMKFKKDQLPIFQDFEMEESKEELIGEIIIIQNRKRWWQFWKKI